MLFQQDKRSCTTIIRSQQQKQHDHYKLPIESIVLLLLLLFDYIIKITVVIVGIQSTICFDSTIITYSKNNSPINDNNNNYERYNNKNFRGITSILLLLLLLQLSSPLVVDAYLYNIRTYGTIARIQPSARPLVLRQHHNVVALHQSSIPSSDNGIMNTIDPIRRRNEASYYIQRGMEIIRNTGNVQESIDVFTQAATVDPSVVPYLWQRGLSYYYNEQYDAASQQFRTDVVVNPYDTEEIVWDIASQCRSLQDKSDSSLVVFPLPNALSLPKNGSDRRRIMPYVYRLFRGEGTEEDLAIAGQTGSIADEFYSLFYLGLFCESCRRNEETKAAMYLKQAVRTKYATSVGSKDYMVSIARVHCKVRGWEPTIKA